MKTREWVEILHCIAEIRAYWVETKPFETDNPQHHYQIARQRCLCLCLRVGKFSKDFSEVRVNKSRVSASGSMDDNSSVRGIMKRN